MSMTDDDGWRRLMIMNDGRCRIWKMTRDQDNDGRWIMMDGGCCTMMMRDNVCCNVYDVGRAM